MPKFFVPSDIHSYYDEMKKALEEAGFDETNDEHWLIGCGDYFDRGPEPLKVMQYLHNLPRKVLVRGNHEQLFEELCDRGWYYDYDITNGTMNTVCKLGNLCLFDDFDEVCIQAKRRVKPFYNQMVNYFETKNYIFVHSWVPSKYVYYAKVDWRDSSDEYWLEACWENPFEYIKNDLLPDKTIVFGHWHCSAGWAKAENRSEFGDDAKFEPYFGDGFIAIDACTAHSGKVNVLVIEDEFLEE